ncbi:uncharacterized protein [Aristolochia californica]|uniref:uncharacterized protein n=1 Tax=Aristolochia californica TaxID=171875 RepID=UPI0035DB8453
MHRNTAKADAGCVSVDYDSGTHQNTAKACAGYTYADNSGGTCQNAAKAGVGCVDVKIRHRLLYMRSRTALCAPSGHWMHHRRDHDGTMLAIPRFDGEYDHWSMLMEIFLRSKEYWTVVVSGVVEPVIGVVFTDAQKTKLEGHKLKDLKAKSYLFQAIDRSILETILCKDTTKHIWDSMKKKYQGTTRAKRQQLLALRSEFEILRMKSRELVTDYFSITMAIVKKMRIHGDKTKDVLIVKKILRSLTPKFNFVVCAIEEANDVDLLSIDELQVELIEDEEDTKVEVEEAETIMIVGTNKKVIITKRINFKGEAEDVEAATQEAEDMEATTQQLINQNLKTNLLRVGQLQEKVYEIVIKDGVCQIQDAKLGLIAQVNMTVNHMFSLYLHNTAHLCFSAKLKDEAWLWHFRYGHLNFGRLKTLQQKNLVTGLPQITVSSQVCEECVVSKQHRNQFPQGKSWRAKKALVLVHSDSCGPITPHANGVFKSYKALVEKEVGIPIKVLRTDSGGEYNSHAFANFCENHGSRRQLTAAYTPQHNSVCERKNCTIMNMVRSLLTTSGISKSFWPEAVNWSIHILNRSPTLVVQNMIPEETWNRKKLVVDYFRIFGCIAYAHISDEKRRKIDNKGGKRIFLRVSDKSKAYKLYNSSTMKIVISRDMVFDEKDAWSWNQNGVKESIPVDFDDDEKW